MLTLLHNPPIVSTKYDQQAAIPNRSGYFYPAGINGGDRGVFKFPCVPRDLDDNSKLAPKSKYALSVTRGCPWKVFVAR